MKRLLAVLFAFTVFSALAFAQGEPEHFGQRSRFPQTCTEGTDSYLSATCAVTPSATTINVSAYYSSDICSAIFTALQTLTNKNKNAVQVTLDARGITASGGVTCGSNPFYSTDTSSIYNVTGELLLGGTQINATATWTIPTRFWVRGIGLSGQNTGDTNLGQNTILRATSWSASSCALDLNLNGSATSDCPVIFIGNPGSSGAYNQADVFAAGISNLTVDCAGISDCIGAASVEVQEGGGIDTVAFINQAVACVDFDAATRSMTSPSTAGVSNSFIRNVNCTTPTATSETMNGIIIDATDGPAEVSNVSVTVPGGSTSFFITGACLVINGANGLNVNYLHCEHAVEGAIIGTTLTSGVVGVVNAVNVHGLTAANMNSSASGATAVLIQDAAYVSVEGVYLTGSGASMPGITDNVNLVTISDQTVGQYDLTKNGQVLITTSGKTPWVLGSEAESSLLSTAPSGSIIYCNNCTSPSNPCTSGGAGALAIRQGSTWVCK